LCALLQNEVHVILFHAKNALLLDVTSHRR
jgi:hypothetical protein